MGNPGFQKSIRGLLLSTGVSAFMKGLRLPLLTALSTLRGLFRVLTEAEDLHAENPLKGITDLKQERPEMSYLSTQEIEGLLSALSGERPAPHCSVLKHRRPLGGIVEYAGSEHDAWKSDVYQNQKREGAHRPHF
jgi:hypothetical protein